MSESHVPPSERVDAPLAFAGIDNFRDFGGGQAPKASLFRSGHLAGATPDDIARLQALGIRTIIDLRRPSERRQRPSPAIAGTRIVTSDDGDLAEAPHLEFLRRGDTSDESVERFLLDYYRKAPFEPRHLPLFAQAFGALDDGPILIHCTAGKDRTGILAALILARYGVAWDIVAADFLRTNAAMLREPYLSQTKILAQQLLGHPPSETVIHAMLGVEERHLRAAFDAIRYRAGDVHSYIATLRQE